MLYQYSTRLRRHAVSYIPTTAEEAAGGWRLAAVMVGCRDIHQHFVPLAGLVSGDTYIADIYCIYCSHSNP